METMDELLERVEKENKQRERPYTVLRDVPLSNWAKLLIRWNEQKTRWRVRRIARLARKIDFFRVETVKEMAKAEADTQYFWAVFKSITDVPHGHDLHINDKTGRLEVIRYEKEQKDV